MDFTKLATKEQLAATQKALQTNGFTVTVVKTGAEAKAKVLELLPQGDDVLTYTSETLETSGIADAINNSGSYNGLRKKLYSDMDPIEKLKMGAVPQHGIGSVHAVTEDGTLVIASNSGSQLPAHAYSAPHMIWVISTKKIVPDLDTAMKRLYEHVLPLESERAKKAYGVEGSYVSKVLLIHREVNPERGHIILVEEDLGY